MVPLGASFAQPDIITFPLGRSIITEWYIRTESKSAIGDHVFATGSKSMHGEFGVVTPPATSTVPSGSRTALHCLRRFESGGGAVSAQALAGDRNEASIISAAEFMPAPDESHPPTTRMRVCGQVFRKIITDIPLHRLMLEGAMELQAPIVGPAKAK